MKKIGIEAYRFLKKNDTAVIATSYLNLPYASTIYYLVDDKFNFHFATKMNTDKFLNLKANKNVSLVVGVGPKHVSVQVRGQATVVKGKNQRKRILESIEEMLHKKVKVWPIRLMSRLKGKRKAVDQEVVYKIIPQHLSFINIDDKDYPVSMSKRHHRIIPDLERKKSSKK